MDCMAQTSNFSRVVWILMSLTNDDGHVNESGQKAISYKNGKKTTLHLHHALFYIRLPSLQDYDVKLPNFTFCGGHEHKIATFFFFS